MKKELDIAIISDVHLGTYGCHAKELLAYLKSIEPKILVLNGDFIDMWQFRKSYFPKEHIQVLQKIMKMSVKGTKVYYITGNHDDALRRYTDFSTGNIHLRDKLVLQLKGKKVWIFHGDIFDLLIKYSPIVAKMGGKGYDYLIRMNRLINKIRQRMGKPRMSFAQKVKDRVKEAGKFISDFENTAIDLAFQNEYDYVICGHIHKPTQRKVVRNGQEVNYLNSGDWVENLTALEYNYGKWSIFQYDEADFEVLNKRLKVKGEPSPEDLEMPMTQEAFLERFMEDLKIDEKDKAVYV